MLYSIIMSDENPEIPPKIPQGTHEQPGASPPQPEDADVSTQQPEDATQTEQKPDGSPGQPDKTDEKSGNGAAGACTWCTCTYT